MNLSNFLCEVSRNHSLKSSNTLFCMDKRQIRGPKYKGELHKVSPLQVALADAIWYWMQKSGCKTDRDVSRLAEKAGTPIAYRSIYSYLHPEMIEPKRQHIRHDDKESKVGQFPTVDKLQAIAKALGCQVWQLLHPNAQLADALGRDYITPVDDEIRVAQPRKSAPAPLQAKKPSRASH